MSVEIHRADARLRRRTFIVIGLSLLVGIAAISMFHRWLEVSTDHLPLAVVTARLYRIIAVSMAGCSLCLLVLAGYFARLGRRVADDRRWPPLRTRALRDTPVRIGADALSFARVLHVAAIVCFVLAIGTALLGVHLLVQN